LFFAVVKEMILFTPYSLYPGHGLHFETRPESGAVYVWGVRLSSSASQHHQILSTRYRVTVLQEIDIEISNAAMQM
jgi:hypothetical protein